VEVLVLAAAVKFTVVDPLPLFADDTVSHAALLLTVHGQPAPVARLTLPLPPLAGKLALLALSV